MKDLNSNNIDGDKNNKRLSMKAQKIKNQRTTSGGLKLIAKVLIITVMLI